MAFHRAGGGEYLLYELQPGGLGHAQPGRAGDRHLNLPATQGGGQLTESFRRLFPHLGHMALICMKNGMILVVQHHDFDRGGADIDAYTQIGDLLSIH